MKNNILYVESDTSKPNLYLQGRKNENKVEKEKKFCPFCEPGFTGIKEGVDNQLIEHHPEEPILWVKNKFPIIDDLEMTLFIETDKCDEHMGTYEVTYIQKLINYMLACKNKMMQTGKYQDVLLFRNYGLQAGGSVPHAHTQLNGIKNPNLQVTYRKDAYEGLLIYQSNRSSATCNISDKPFTEYYEFNISWSEENMPYDAALYLQKAISFMNVFKNGSYIAYNLDEIDCKHHIKVIYRANVTVYLLAWDLHLVNKDLEKIVEEFKMYTNL